MRKVLFPHRHFDGRRLHSSRRPEPVEVTNDKQVLPSSAKVLEDDRKKSVRKATGDA